MVVNEKKITEYQNLPASGSRRTGFGGSNLYTFPILEHKNDEFFYIGRRRRKDLTTPCLQNFFLQPKLLS